jgi:hypothetical protein
MMLKSVHLDGHHDVTLEEFEIMWKNKPADGWDFASHVSGFMSGAVAGMAGLVGGEAYVQGGEAPRGKPIQHVHYRTIYHLGQQVPFHPLFLSLSLSFISSVPCVSITIAS